MCEHTQQTKIKDELNVCDQVSVVSVVVADFCTTTTLLLLLLLLTIAQRRSHDDCCCCFKLQLYRFNDDKQVSTSDFKLSIRFLFSSYNIVDILYLYICVGVCVCRCTITSIRMSEKERERERLPHTLQYNIQERRFKILEFNTISLI